MREEKKLDVYNEKVEELYKRLETNINGLSEIEAKKRLERDGENKLEESQEKLPLARKRSFRIFYARNRGKVLS